MIMIIVPQIFLPYQLLPGAAVGPQVAGLISSQGWSYVFLMLMMSDLLALLVSKIMPSNAVFRSVPLSPQGEIWITGMVGA